MKLHLSELQFEVLVLKKGKHVFDMIEPLDIWLWQLSGRSVVSINSTERYDMTHYFFMKIDANRLVLMYS